jgi:hypothetical protein
MSNPTLDALVEWMRSKGVVHMVSGGITLTLGPPPPSAAPSLTSREQDVREAEEDDVRALFQSTPADISDEVIGWMREKRHDG